MPIVLSPQNNPIFPVTSPLSLPIFRVSVELLTGGLAWASLSAMLLSISDLGMLARLSCARGGAIKPRSALLRCLGPKD